MGHGLGLGWVFPAPVRRGVRLWRSEQRGSHAWSVCAVRLWQNAATALYETAKMLLDRTGNNAIQEYCTTECLKHVFVSWLQVYQGISQNSMRHLASWWLYQEWHQQLEFDVQGFPNQFLGKSYEEHVQRAADMVDHTVAIHETTYLPVSPSHRTAQEESAATAAAQPLVPSNWSNGGDDEDSDVEDYELSDVEDHELSDEETESLE